MCGCGGQSEKVESDRQADPHGAGAAGREARDGEDLLAAQLAAGKSRRSYRDFLQKFAVLHEELHADPEEFDLSYYTYGLSVYGNLPLIEPLESREVKKIREFVIVIDTSYSTSGELVEQFFARDGKHPAPERQFLLRVP